MSSLGSMRSIAFSGLKGIGVSSGEGSPVSAGLFYTVDGGQNWKASSLSTASSSNVFASCFTAIDGDNAIALCNSFYAAGQATVYYSSNAGQTWTASTRDGVAGSFLSITGEGPAIAISGITALLGADGDRLYSDSAGANWVTANGSPPKIYSIKIAPNGKAIAATEGGARYFTNNTLGWQTPTATVGSSLPPVAKSVAMNNSGRAIYTSTNALYYSTDYGVTITKALQATPTGLDFPNRLSIATTTGGTTNCILVNSAGQIWYSSDGGEVWTRANFVSGGFASAGGDTPAVMISGSNAVIGSDNLSVYSLNSGVTWTISTTAITAVITGAVFLNGLNGVMATNANTFYTTDGGNNWTPIELIVPLITGISPDFATRLGGQSITISGTNLSGTSATVTFDTTTVPGTINLDGTITATAPAHSTGPVDVFVTVDGARSADAFPFSYIYCFKEGTKILTDKGYMLIQDLRKGDLVKTVSSDFKKIEHIGHSKMYHNANDVRSKNKLYRCPTSEYPELTEDLIITGCHSILVKQFKDHEQMEKTQDVLGKIYVTEAHYRLPACVADRTKIFDEEGVHTIWHFSLEHDNYYANYGIYANGLLVETTSNRMMVELSGMTLL
jgi:hypothetical protein